MMIGDLGSGYRLFHCMLAALENVPNDHVEAAQVDGASSPQIFRDYLAQVLPVAVTVLLIRMIERSRSSICQHYDRRWTWNGNRIDDLQSFVWRANDMGSSAAIAYMLLIYSCGLCVVFNYVVLGQVKG